MVASIKKPRLATGLSVVLLDDLEPTEWIVVAVGSIRIGRIVPIFSSRPSLR